MMTTIDSPSGKVALVTGGARRVGRAVAITLAEAGYHVAVTYRTSRNEAQTVIEAIRQLGRDAEAFACDMADSMTIDALHNQITQRFGRLDALVNNAAIFSPTPVAALTVTDYDRFQAVNARGPLLLTQRMAPLLAAHYDANDPTTMGRVVNFVDIHVMGEPMSGYAAYNASKAALLEITRTCAVELAPQITVNAVAPGVVAWAESFDETHRQAYLKRVPLQRAGTPDDAAAAVRFLICDAHYCTGQVICVDGGRSLR